MTLPDVYTKADGEPCSCEKDNGKGQHVGMSVFHDVQVVVVVESSSELESARDKGRARRGEGRITERGLRQNGWIL